MRADPFGRSADGGSDCIAGRVLEEGSDPFIHNKQLVDVLPKVRVAGAASSR